MFQTLCLLSVIFLLFSSRVTTNHAAASIRVMSFNIWHGGEAGKQPLAQTAKVIQDSRADIVGLQETGGFEQNGSRPDHGRKLAELLGWNYHDQGQRTGILSRFPIVTNSPSHWGVSLRMPSGTEIWMFNVHLMHAPYQPYQLLNIPYADAPFIKTAAEAISEARRARGGQVERLLADLKPALASGRPIFLTGDFNEPSHQDWTKRAARAGICPIPVEYPTTLAITQAGLLDTYRLAFPNELTHHGYTWTPITRPDDPKDRHDRIDFVFMGGSNLVLENCQVVGEDSKYAEIVIQPYPSDHRAVVGPIKVP